MTTDTNQDKTIDAYLATVPEAHRPALERLRELIKRFYPSATEHIAYGKPLFKLNGHPLGGFYASRRHSALYVWSGEALSTLGDMLDGYDIAMSTVRFAPDQALPDHLVKAVLDARAKEIKDHWG